MSLVDALNSSHALNPSPVAPCAMSDTTDIHTRRNSRRLAASTRQAAMHATPEELVTLRRVIDAANTGTITTQQAHRAIDDLRRIQADRNGWPPKRDTHDPDACRLMICPDPACLEANARRVPSGNASPLRRAA